MVMSEHIEHFALPVSSGITRRGKERGALHPRSPRRRRGGWCPSARWKRAALRGGAKIAPIEKPRIERDEDQSSAASRYRTLDRVKVGAAAVTEDDDLAVDHCQATAQLAGPSKKWLKRAARREGDNKPQTIRTPTMCLRITTRAEMPMANEIDRGQANGELPPAHRQKKASRAPTLPHMGFRRRSTPRLATGARCRRAGGRGSYARCFDPGVDWQKGTTPNRSG